MAGFVTLPFWAAGLVAGASSLYAASLTISAAVQRPRRKAAVQPLTPRTRFAVLVPAHNESLLIRRTLRSLQSLDYPRGLADIYVIADNCGDDTAEIARSCGVQVLERHDLDRRGKGYALDWALGQIALSDYDAVAMFDADTVAGSGFLRAMDARLAGGAEAVQGYYAVLHPESTAEALRSISFALMHYVRPLGKEPFRGSCGLKGNGMAFSVRLLQEVGWKSFSVVEDAEQGLRIVDAGHRVEFAPEARIEGEMPGSLRGARTQNLRWEAGRWMVARRWSLPLLARGLRRRSLAAIDAALEPMVPPLSVVVALGAVSALGGFLLGSQALAALGLASLAGVALHVIGGMMVAGVPPKAWRALLAAPLYLAWKVALYAQALLGVGARRWVRTPRTTSPEE